MAEQIDFLTRRCVAKWVQTVATEGVGVTNHADRLLIAKRMAESISPATPAQDSALVHVIFLVRTFLSGPEEDANEAAVAILVGQIMTVFVAIGAFKG
jgi:hypothetical protein